MPETSPAPGVVRDEWPGAARAAALLYLARLALGWGEPLGAEELVLDAAIWWVLFLLGLAILPARPDIWVRVFASGAVTVAAFLSFAGFSLKEAALVSVLTLAVTLVGLGRHVGPPQTGAITLTLAVPVGFVLLLRGPPEAMPGIAFLALLVLLVGHRDLRWASVLAIGASLVGMPHRPPTWRTTAEVPEGPDIVLVVADTLRADSAAEMQTVRRLVAGGGHEFEAVAPSPWTLPSMATLMTGVAPDVHGAGLRDDGVARIAPGYPTLARQLHERGYDTAAVLAENGYLSRRFGLMDGLAEVRGGIGRGSELVFRLDDRGRRVLSRALRDLGVPVGLWGRAWGVEDAVADVDRVLAGRRNRPLFLWVHLMEAHMPWEHASSPESHLRRERVLADPAYARNPKPLREAHAVQMHALDEGLSDLVAVLGPPPPRGRVLVLVSDHGEELFEHGGFEHGHAFWQELLSVPLVVQGITPHPTAAIHRLGLADVNATLLVAAGIEPEGPGRPIQRMVGPSVLRAQGALYGDPGYAVYRGRYKLVAQGAERQLFDLEEDPGEQHDLAAEKPELVQRLVAFAPGEGAFGPAVGLSDDERARLEALGYHVPDGAAPAPAPHADGHH
ncbi:MAG: hypothetical protein EP330_05830 [Deltaproteobacteria bacterium]|nr:MAG: hypothetical protein EP330_05830 [Deltaproteobacteria bacterium]